MRLFKKYILTMVIMAGIAGCNSLLEPVDDNHLDESRINFDPAFAEGVLMNAYASLINQFTFIEAGTDDAVTNNLTSGYRRMAVGEWTAQFSPASRWNNYEAIFYINKFIPTIENVRWKRDDTNNELFKMRLMGEALALRGLHHYFILQAHAGMSKTGELLGIPYYTEFIESNGNFNVPRLSFEETVAAINRDFEDAIELLPMDYVDDASNRPEIYMDVDEEAYKFVFGAVNRLRISSRIIKSYQAKLALFADSPAFLDGTGPYYQQAANLAADLINDIGGVAGLDPGGLEFYNENSDRNLNEFIWRGSVYNASWVEEDQFPPSLNGEGTINPSLNLVESFPMKNGLPISDPNSGYDPANPFQDRDPRLAKYIVYDGNTIGGKTIRTGYGAKIDRVDSIPQLSTRTGFYLKKLLRPDVVISADGTTTDREHFNVFLRYTDIFLVFAEAANELGGPDEPVKGITAREVIAAIRERAGIDQPDEYLNSITTREGMRELIRNERRLELSFEGHRFWDLRRWKLDLNEEVEGLFRNQNDVFTEFEVERRDYDGHAIYGPIPQSEIIKFNNLVQNAGW
jgi:hypothetical protein